MSKKKETKKKTKAGGRGRPPMLENSTTLVVKLDGEIMDRIDTLANDNYRTRSAQMRLMIDNYFKDSKK